MKNLITGIIFCFFTTVSPAQQTAEEESSVLTEQGVAKAEKKDLTGAINDFTKAIALNGKNAAAYFNRAASRNELKDYRGAIEDFSKAIYLNNDDQITAASFYGRGQCYYSLGNKSNACMDFNKASGLGNQDATSAVQNNCN
jgi:tetratricopeptide (TPR) repeat protein